MLSLSKHCTFVTSVTSDSSDTPIKITSTGCGRAYGLGVGTTGLIFAAIAIAWLAYLVPHYVRRRDDETTDDEVDPTNRFADSMRIVRHGTAPLLDQDLAEIEKYEVSTPQTRRAAIDDLRRLESEAALRRRRVLLVLMAGISAVIGVCAVELIPWWSMAIPGGLLVIFVVVARISVRFMTKSLDARYQQIAHGSDESTIFLSIKKPAEPEAKKSGPATKDADASDVKAGALWDPVPITMPTYVSKPLAPRTVRTIDLSGPPVDPANRPQVPVTADAPEPEKAPDAEDEADDNREAASA